MSYGSNHQRRILISYWTFHLIALQTWLPPRLLLSLTLALALTQALTLVLTVVQVLDLVNPLLLKISLTNTVLPLLLLPAPYAMIEIHPSHWQTSSSLHWGH
jgi:hypothetical protein